MGNELGMYIEWRYYEALQWFLVDEYDTHAHQLAFTEALNHLYLKEAGLWHFAYDSQGFEWIDADNDKQSIISFVRRGKKPSDDLLVIINFDPASYETFRTWASHVKATGSWCSNTDRQEFGGSGYPVVDLAIKPARAVERSRELHRDIPPGHGRTRLQAREEVLIRSAQARRHQEENGYQEEGDGPHSRGKANREGASEESPERSQGPCLMGLRNA